MSVRPLIYAPHPLFAQPSQRIIAIDADVHALAVDMFDTMRVHGCIGFAAVQIGVLQRMALLHLNPNHTEAKVLINPTVEPLTDTPTLHEEASPCLPGISARVSRPQHVNVTYLDLSGNEQRETMTGWAAVCIQHQCDHHDGLLYVDRLPKLQRALLLERSEKHRRTARNSTS